LQSYGARLSHRGSEYYTVDFGMPVGTPVHAARGGVVVLVEDGNDRGCWQEGCDRFANFVVVLHSDGTTGEYFHLERGSVVVRVGDAVRRGQLLARSGNTGYTTAPHLHFGVYRAAPDGSTFSLPVRFQTRTGVINAPRSGAYYLNLDP
jgi:murein DD-endopeptidase MepM/ murein hydrolase activator NlpD